VSSDVCVCAFGGKLGGADESTGPGSRSFALVRRLPSSMKATNLWAGAKPGEQAHSSQGAAAANCAFERAQMLAIVGRPASSQPARRLVPSSNPIYGLRMTPIPANSGAGRAQQCVRELWQVQVHTHTFCKHICAHKQAGATDENSSAAAATRHFCTQPVCARRRVVARRRRATRTHTRSLAHMQKAWRRRARRPSIALALAAVSVCLCVCAPSSLRR
jgi:hypothetical protein